MSCRRPTARTPVVFSVARRLPRACREQRSGMRVSLTVNSQAVTADVEPRLLLVEFVRDRLGLTGTKVGCDTGQCGSCTLMLNGQSAKSCSVLAVQADGGEVTTIEGVNP